MKSHVFRETETGARVVKLGKILAHYGLVKIFPLVGLRKRINKQLFMLEISRLLKL